MGVLVKTERFGIARQWNARIIDSSGLCGFQAPLGTLVGGGPAAVNTRAVSMWVQAVPPSDGISAVDL